MLKTLFSLRPKTHVTYAKAIDDWKSKDDFRGEMTKAVAPSVKVLLELIHRLHDKSKISSAQATVLLLGGKPVPLVPLAAEFWEKENIAQELMSLLHDVVAKEKDPKMKENIHILLNKIWSGGDGEKVSDIIKEKVKDDLTGETIRKTTSDALAQLYKDKLIKEKIGLLKRSFFEICREEAKKQKTDLVRPPSFSREKLSKVKELETAYKQRKKDLKPDPVKIKLEQEERRKREEEDKRLREQNLSDWAANKWASDVALHEKKVQERGIRDNRKYHEKKQDSIRSDWKKEQREEDTASLNQWRIQASQGTILTRQQKRQKEEAEKDAILQKIKASSRKIQQSNNLNINKDTTSIYSQSNKSNDIDTESVYSQSSTQSVILTEGEQEIYDSLVNEFEKKCSIDDNSANLPQPFIINELPEIEREVDQFLKEQENRLGEIEEKSLQLETHCKNVMEQISRVIPPVPEKDVDRLMDEIFHEVDMEQENQLRQASDVPSGPLLEKKERKRKKRLSAPLGN